MDLVCKNCNALLGVGNVFCVNCGSPITTSVEAEFETVIRRTTSKTSSTASIAVGLTILAGTAAAFILMYALTPATPITAPRTEAQPTATQFPTPPSTRTQTTKPSPAPTRERIAADVKPTPRTPTPDEIRQRMGNAATIPANRPAYMPPPAISEFDKNGRRLRAICKNGEPSYWQYDKFATCGMNGGVARWNPNHPGN